MDLRTYTSHYRGRIAVHAAKTVERDACWENDLNPNNLDAGGIVGTVELVDVIPLTPADYEARQAEHLSGRSYREGMYGWLLAHPEPLPEFLPAPGRTNLFNIELGLSAQADAARQSPAVNPPARQQKTVYTAHLNGTTPEKPFALHVQPLTGATTDYALTLKQRVAERPDSDPRLETVVVISGDNLRAVADHVIEALRKAEYKATDLSPTRQKPFYLPEEAGVRLGLTLLTVKPLSKFRRVEQISYGIRQMPSEEIYYWYSKCTAADTAERAQKALRVLLAAE
jgi:hypothetical protein